MEISLKYTPNTKVWNKAREEINQLSGVIAGIVAESMSELVRNSPQMTGDYVASWYVGTVPGGGEWKSPGELPPPGEYYYRGSEPAITAALQTVRRFQDSYSSRYSQVTSVSGLPSIHINNPVSYSEAAAHQSGRSPGKYWDDDPGNPGTTRVFANAMSQLTAVLSKRIYVGMDTWKFYYHYRPW